MVTGFSPPVIRSAAMFSFFAVGQAINRNSNGFNSLAASAFIILLINPFQITDLGFQLSYAAIAGILLFYHPVYNAWNPTHWMVDKIWALIAVSVAAQLGTLPLSLYYFHQFPTYFIPTNLVIVPLSGLIIYAGLALLILSFWPLAFSLLSFALKYLLASLNWLVVHVEFLPGSSIQNIYLSATETLVVAAMILIIAVWIKKPLQIYVFFFLSFVLTFTTLKAVRLFSNENQKLLVIHNTRKHVAFSLINNHECLMLADSIIIKKVQSASVNMMLAYNVKKCYTLYMQQIKKDTSLCLTSIHCFFEKNLVIQIEGIRLVFLCDKRILKFSCQPKQYADYLILNENSGITINEALNYFNTPKIITGFGYKSKPVKNEFRNEKNEISIFFVNEQGIYKADL
jgi:competence protein ComEC